MLNRDARPPGRPRSEKTRKAILKTAFRLLKKNGFDRVSSRQIALEAGVSTATLYRWWRNKQEVLLDAYIESTRQLLPPGRRGSPLARLRMYTLRIAEFLHSGDGRAFLLLMAAIQDNPALRQAFVDKVYLPRRAEGRAVVEEAILAGELSRAADPDIVIHLLIGSQILPALLGQSPGAAFTQKILAFVLEPDRRG